MNDSGLFVGETNEQRGSPFVEIRSFFALESNVKKDGVNECKRTFAKSLPAKSALPQSSS